MTGLAEGLAIKGSQAVTVVTAFVVMGLLFWFLQKTRTGKSMRAFSDNEDLALLSGINPRPRGAGDVDHRRPLASHRGRPLRLDKSFKPFVYFPAPAAHLRGGHRGWPRLAHRGHRGRLRHRLLGSHGDLCLEEGRHYLVPESMAPDGLVQLLSTDYKFRGQLRDPDHRADLHAHGPVQGEIGMTRNLALFRGRGLLFVLTGVFQSWNLALSILNPSLISAIMALG